MHGLHQHNSHAWMPIMRMWKVGACIGCTILLAALNLAVWSFIKFSREGQDEDAGGGKECKDCKPVRPKPAATRPQYRGDKR